MGLRGASSAPAGCLVVSLVGSAARAAVSGVERGAQKARQPSAGLGANCPLAFELADASPGARAPARRPRVLQRSVVARFRAMPFGTPHFVCFRLETAASIVGRTGHRWGAEEGVRPGQESRLQQGAKRAATTRRRQAIESLRERYPFFALILASVQKEPARATGLQRTQGSEARSTAAARAHDEQGLGPLRAPRGRVGLRAL